MIEAEVEVHIIQEAEPQVAALAMIAGAGG